MLTISDPFLRSCCECGKRKYCLADDLIGNRINAQKSNLIQNVNHPPESYVFNQGDLLKNLFFVKSGSVKNVYTGENGDQQIINFHFPGETIGLLPLRHSYHSTSAITLENSIICMFSLEFILANCERFEDLLSKFLARSEAEIRHRHESLLSINHLTADKRLGIFLVDLIDRQNLNQNNSASLRLTMPRADIANYLGLAPETVSRTLSKFQKLGLLLTSKKNIRIIDISGLTKFVS